MKNHRHASCCFCRPPNIHSRSQRSHIYSYFSLHVLHAFMYIHGATTGRADACEARARVFHARDKGQRETLFKPDTSNHRARWKSAPVCVAGGETIVRPVKNAYPRRPSFRDGISYLASRLQAHSPFSLFPRNSSIWLKSPLTNVFNITPDTLIRRCIDIRICSRKE